MNNDAQMLRDLADAIDAGEQETIELDAAQLRSIADRLDGKDTALAPPQEGGVGGGIKTGPGDEV